MKISVNDPEHRQQFPHVAFGEALGVGNDQRKCGKSLELDEGGWIDVEPDLSWWSAAPRASAGSFGSTATPNAKSWAYSFTTHPKPRQDV